MEQESIKEILLFIENEEDYETFSEILSTYASVTKPNKDLVLEEDENYLAFCILDEKLNKSNIINFRKKNPNIKFIGVYDQDNFLEFSSNIYINYFINHNLLENEKEMRKFFSNLNIPSLDNTLAFILEKKSKAFNLNIKNENTLKELVEKICSLVANIKKIDPKSLLEIFNNILKTNKNEELVFSYGIDREKLVFNIIGKNLINLNSIEDLYNLVLNVENTKTLSLTLKNAILKALNTFNTVLLNIGKTKINYTFSYYLNNFEGKYFVFTGKNFYLKIEENLDKTISNSKKLDSYMKTDNEFNDQEKTSIDKIIKEKSNIMLHPVDYDNLTIDEVLDLLKKNNEILDKKFKQTIEDYKLLLKEKLHIEKISDILGEEIKDLLKSRKEPSTDAELKDIKRKLEDKIYKLYRELGVQKAKTAKLITHINLLKDKIVQSRINQDKLKTEIKEKNKKIELLEEQLRKMEKSLLEF